MTVKAYLEITLYIEEEKRAAAVTVFTDYREPFLTQIEGALTKDLLVRDEDVQVLHGFADLEAARNRVVYQGCGHWSAAIVVQGPRNKNLLRCLTVNQKARVPFPRYKKGSSFFSSNQETR